MDIPEGLEVLLLQLNFQKRRSPFKVSHFHGEEGKIGTPIDNLANGLNVVRV
jgi:hypothetical protein